MKNVLCLHFILIFITASFAQSNPNPSFQKLLMDRPLKAKIVNTQPPTGLILQPIQVASYPSQSEITKINNYFNSLPSWSSTHPSQSLIKTKVGSSTLSSEVYSDYKAESGQRKYNCNTTTYNIKNSPDKIVTMNPDFNILFPGAILQGNGISGGLGSLAEFPVRMRSPLRIYTDIPGQTKINTVSNPDAASVKQAIAELINNASGTQIPISSSIFYDSYTSSSIEESLLSIGLSVNYVGFKAKGDLQVNKAANENTVTFYFVQRAFSVGVVSPPTPAHFFNNQFTYADLLQQVNQGTIAPNNIPVYVAGVAYGRILLFTLTSTSSIDSIKAAVTASYTTVVSGSLDYKYKQILSSSRITIATLGGSASDAENLIRNGNIGDFFKNNTDIRTMVPVFYQFNNIIDRTPAKFVETTTYNLKECTPLPNNPTDVGDYAQCQIIGIKVLSDCDYGFTDDHRADLFGEINIDGNQVWKLEDSEHGRLPDIAKDQIFPIPNSQPMPIIEASAPNQFGKEFRSDNEVFNIYGILGDWEPTGAYDLMKGFDENIPFSDFKNYYGQIRTIHVQSDFGKCNMEIRYKFIKKGDVIEWNP